jgi:hypothetical protein
MERVDVKTLFLLLIAAGLLAWADIPGHTRPAVTSSQFSEFHATIVADSRDSAPDQDDDTLGNEVTHAVAEYALDREGALYEMHAPQVELPHLGSPKS